MSTTTDKLALFKYDPRTDGTQTFNIQKALNDNWDKLDDAQKRSLQLWLTRLRPPTPPGTPKAALTPLPRKASVPPPAGMDQEITAKC